MHVRFAVPNDLETCLHLDDLFDTRRVCSLIYVRAATCLGAAALGGVAAELRLDYPSPESALLMHWQRGYSIMVAEDWPGVGVVGYVDVGPEPDVHTGWLWHLVVDRHWRRQGIGALLLRRHPMEH